VSEGQINFQVPKDLRGRLAEVLLIEKGRVAGRGQVQLDIVAPALFSMNSDGKGVAAGSATRVRTDGSRVDEPLFQYDSVQRTFTTRPIVASGDQLYLVLYGTGIRGRSGLAGVQVVLNAILVPTLYAGPQPEFVGVDQINVGPLPPSLGKGTVFVVLTVDGLKSNAVTFELQ
jgi:uncharacterized protein (TIGR03437 family)